MLFVPTNRRAVVRRERDLPRLSGNLVTNPNDLSNASWTQVTQCTITGNTTKTLAPDGTHTASLMVPTAVSGASHFTGQSAITTSAVRYACRGRFKDGGYGFVRFGIIKDNVYSAYNVAHINIQTAQITNIENPSNGWPGTWTVERIGNGWILGMFEMNAVADTGAQHHVEVYVHDRPVSGTAYTGNTVDGMFAWGLELAPVP